jgi:hypothetical protein
MCFIIKAKNVIHKQKVYNICKKSCSIIFVAMHLNRGKIQI